jgi:hypothetical protein
MLRLMFDTNGYGALAADPQGFAKLRALVDRSDVEVFVTHVQEDELSAMSDVPKRKALLSICRTLGTKIPTDGAVWDVSNWNEAKWGPGSGDVRSEHVQSGSSNRGEDELIAATASSEVDVLVTDDERLRHRIVSQGSTVAFWTFAELLKYMESLSPQ